MWIKWNGLSTHKRHTHELRRTESSVAWIWGSKGALGKRDSRERRGMGGASVDSGTRAWEPGPGESRAADVSTRAAQLWQTLGRSRQNMIPGSTFNHINYAGSLPTFSSGLWALCTVRIYQIYFVCTIHTVIPVTQQRFNDCWMNEWMNEWTGSECNKEKEAKATAIKWDP